MTKAELVKLSGIDSSKLDYAMPQVYVDKCANVGIDALAIYAGWIYDDESYRFGRPLLMAELWELAYNKLSLEK